MSDLTHIHRVDSSTKTLWTGLFPIAGSLVSFYYWRFIEISVYNAKSVIRSRILQRLIWITMFANYVCVELLLPSHPNGVMSSVISLPIYHTFTVQALSSKRLTSIVHILSPETDNCPFLNQWKGTTDRRKYFMIKSPRKNVADLAGVEPATSWSPVRRTSNWTTKVRIYPFGDFPKIGLLPDILTII